jgi:hypothetical protein
MSHEGGKETQDKEKKEQVHKESDGADETESGTENEDGSYVPNYDKGADDNDNEKENTDVPGNDEGPDDDADGADENFGEENEASDELDEPHPEEKKKDGRKNKKLNRFDQLFLERLASCDTDFHRELNTPPQNVIS